MTSETKYLIENGYMQPCKCGNSFRWIADMSTNGFLYFNQHSVWITLHIDNQGEHFTQQSTLINTHCNSKAHTYFAHSTSSVTHQKATHITDNCTHCLNGFISLQISPFSFLLSLQQAHFVLLGLSLYSLLKENIYVSLPCGPCDNLEAACCFSPRGKLQVVFKAGCCWPHT